jgi:hypothetical protein
MRFSLQNLNVPIQFDFRGYAIVSVHGGTALMWESHFHRSTAPEVLVFARRIAMGEFDFSGSGGNSVHKKPTPA